MSDNPEWTLTENCYTATALVNQLLADDRPRQLAALLEPISEAARVHNVMEWRTLAAIALALRQLTDGTLAQTLKSTANALEALGNARDAVDRGDREDT